jgi:hypothetical protein
MAFFYTYKYIYFNISFLTHLSLMLPVKFEGIFND